MSDASAVTEAKPPKKRGVLLPLILFLVAAVAFGAVFVMYDGTKLATDLYGQAMAALGGPAGGPLTPPAQVEPTATISIDPDLAKRMYVEQIESARNLERMADGEVVAFDVTSIDQSETNAVVGLRARFADDSTAVGALAMVKIQDTWFVFSLSGMRNEETGGMADTVNQSAAMEASETLDTEFEQAGIKTVDEDVLSTMIEQQKANQSLAKGVLDGTYTKMSLGKPVKGAGTITVPVTLIEASGGTAKGQIVMVSKTVEGKNRLFVTTLSMQ